MSLRQFVLRAAEERWAASAFMLALGVILLCAGGDTAARSRRKACSHSPIPGRRSFRDRRCRGPSHFPDSPQGMVEVQAEIVVVS